MSRHTFDQPSEVSAELGQVLVDGPDGVAIALTPEAAIETSDRLVHGATQAHGQRIEAEKNRWRDVDRA